MPKVSVLMTVYNNERYIRTAIFSILNQTFKDIEVVVINDGSTDDTEKIILSFNDSRIRYFVNNKNLGISKSLNRGIGLCSGEYVARMDGDDISHPQRLEKQVRFFDTNSDYGLLGSWYYIIDGNSILSSVQRKDIYDKDIKLSMIFANQFLQSSILIRTDLLNLLKYNEKFEVCEDYDLWLRCLDHTLVANLPEELLTYRWYGKNTCIVKQKLILKTFIEIFARTFDDIGIAHSKDELFIHSVMAFNLWKQYFNTDERINALNEWLHKISNTKVLCERFNYDIVQIKINNLRNIMIQKPESNIVL